jgi:hypothetical protein
VERIDTQTAEEKSGEYGTEWSCCRLLKSLWKGEGRLVKADALLAGDVAYRRVLSTDSEKRTYQIRDGGGGRGALVVLPPYHLFNLVGGQKRQTKRLRIRTADELVREPDLERRRE